MFVPVPILYGHRRFWTLIKRQHLQLLQHKTLPSAASKTVPRTTVHALTCSVARNKLIANTVDERNHARVDRQFILFSVSYIPGDWPESVIWLQNLDNIAIGVIQLAGPTCILRCLRDGLNVDFLNTAPNAPTNTRKGHMFEEAMHLFYPNLGYLRSFHEKQYHTFMVSSFINFSDCVTNQLILRIPLPFGKLT